jgi:hypothetical protein
VIGIRSRSPPPAPPALPFPPPAPPLPLTIKLSIKVYASPLKLRLGIFSLSARTVTFSNSPYKVLTDYGFISFINTSRDGPVY